MIDEGMKKIWWIHTMMFYSTIKENDVSFCRKVGRTGDVMFQEISQT